MGLLAIVVGVLGLGASIAMLAAWGQLVDLLGVVASAVAIAVGTEVHSDARIAAIVDPLLDRRQRYRASRWN